MSAMDMLSNAARSATGAIAKAYIKFSPIEKRKEVNVEEVKAKKGRSRLSFDTLAMENTLAREKDFRTQLIGGVLSRDKSEIFGGDDVLEVHFNPNQVSFQARPGRKVQKQDYARKQKGEPGDVNYTYVMAAPRITMTVPLIFQDFERSDAFMMEKLSDPAAMARFGITSAANAINKDSYSVRPVVEGLISVMQSHYRKVITFAWGKMFYTGVLNSVNAEYTMFNMSGNPIRAVVTLNMILTPDEDAFTGLSKDMQGMLKDNFQEPWKESYDNLIQNQKDYTDFGSVGNTVGNLFNLKL